MANDAGPAGNRRDDRSFVTRLGLGRGFGLRPRRSRARSDGNGDGTVGPPVDLAPPASEGGEGVVVPITKATGNRQRHEPTPTPPPPTPGRGFAEIVPTVLEQDDLLPQVPPRRRARRPEVPQAPQDDRWAEAPWSYAPPQE